MIYMFILLCLADLSLSLACSFRMDSLCGLLVGTLTPPSASLSNVDWAGPVQPHTPHIHPYTHTHTHTCGWEGTAQSVSLDDGENKCFTVEL